MARGPAKSIRFYPDDWKSETKGLSRSDRELILHIAVENWHRRQPVAMAYFVMTGEEQTIRKFEKIGLVDIGESGVTACIVHKMKNRTGAMRPLREVWKATIARVFLRDSYTCRYCGQRGGKLECDHVMPLSRGGSNEDSNLVTSCKTCNRIKSDRTPQEMGWILQ